MMLALLSWLCLVRAGLAAARPNVLFIVCDDLNTHVSTSGYPHIRTPAFDHLAAAGMTFRRAYCQYPVCGPSRASFLHGLYPQSTGILSNKTDIRDISDRERFHSRNASREPAIGQARSARCFTTQESIPAKLPGTGWCVLKTMRCRW